ncbi:protein MANBAL isoform X3 [Manis pentadactyla]|uniref:protein MANBAL isoform X3 n=1 Tax=Manis pentadactyla TaxID=143292 RepID=UPI00255D0298|nr:protein MANBAL isoform X3 [Manis pentadactyla]
MASDLDFSPPEVPEPTFLENLLRYGLFLGAIFQLICVLAIIVPVPKSHEVASLDISFIAMASPGTGGMSASTAVAVRGSLLGA